MAPPVITVFGSGIVTPDDPEYRKAYTLGRLLAESRYLVCNGGYGGIMEASARGAKEGGGKTIGIHTESFKSETNPWIDEKEVVPTWRDRLFRLIERGDAYVVLDGGTGTLAELFTVWEMANKHFLSKPIIVLGSFTHALMGLLRKQSMVIFGNNIKMAEAPEMVLSLLKEQIK